MVGKKAEIKHPPTLCFSRKWADVIDRRINKRKNIMTDVVRAKGR